MPRSSSRSGRRHWPSTPWCLLSYSNQLEHRRIDRRTIRDFLLEIAKLQLVEMKPGLSRDEQYTRLSEGVDPKSDFEREFLDYLYKNAHRLPDFAQYQPTVDVHVQPDFYYERQSVPGVCVFIDGPHHDTTDTAAHDKAVRNELENRGFRVIAIRYDRPFVDQVKEHPDVFG